MRILDWFKRPPQWQNRAERHADPGIVACYWDGTGQMSHPVKDVSLTGAYLYTTEPWHVGTMLALTLQEAGECESTSVPASISIGCRVAHYGPDGVGVSFMLHSSKERKALERFLRAAVQRPRVRSALGLELGAQGQALVEFALMVPLAFLLIINAVNFGGFLYDAVTVANAARAGAQYAALGTSSVDTPPEATAAQVLSLVQNETGSLANASSTNPSVSVCVNNNGNQTVLSSSPAASCTTAPTDPEFATGTVPYTVVSVNVTYTYSPFIPLFDFPSLGIHATIPTTTIRRQAIMRVLN